jgi:hypothetical protein
MAGARAPMTLSEQVQRSARDAARRYAGRLTAEQKPPQPTAKVAEQWGFPASGVEEGHRNVQKAMTDLWNWAQVFAPRGGTAGTGFRVNDVQTSGAPEAGFEPTQATMYRVTPEEFFKGQYGDDWGKVKASMEDAPQPPTIQYPAAASVEEHLNNPYFVFMAPRQGLKSHVSGAGRNILINPVQAEQYGASPGYVYQHEWGHAAAPMYGKLREGNPEMDADFLRKVLLDNYPELADNPKILSGLVNKRLGHVSSTKEVPAYLNHLRRLHYGLTGDPLASPQSRLDFLNEVAKGRKSELGKPSMKFEAMFPGAPTMRYGPNAGSPAEGYEKIRQYMRMIMPNLKPGQKRDVIQTFDKGASTKDPNENVYV